ncbi:MAG: hypothetical protein ACJ77N_08920 [Chloroflexota bacterium]
MTASTPALGGTRDVPAPDPIARDYLLLALRLDQHIAGLVDGYFGPADLKARVDIEPLRPPADLAADAGALRSRVADEVVDEDRRDWLDAQLVALETQASAIGGRTLPYVEHVERCLGWRPIRRADDRFAAASKLLDDVLPGNGALDQRLREDDALWTLTVDQARVVVARLIERFRARARDAFGLPDGEDLRFGFVTGQPWGAYNWYDGGRRSRVDVNTDLPLRLPNLLGTIAHETYPGHHLEHAWKEADLVDTRGRLEASVLLINTPECLISEGLANIGRRFVVAAAEESDLLVELAALIELPIARDPVELRRAVERQVAIRSAQKVLDDSRVNAALMRHEDGRSHDEVLEYLVEVGRFPHDVARKRLEFIEHPLWRTYVFVYADGEQLLAEWLGEAGDGAAATQFDRLLHEQLTPRAIAREIASGANAAETG